MLKIKKPDHPMSDIKQARKLLADLPTNDPYKALHELSSWLDSINHAVGFKLKDLGEIVMFIDELGQEYTPRLTRDYMSISRPSKFHELRLWQVNYEFWSHASVLYVACIEQCKAGGPPLTLVADLPLLAARAIHSLSMQMKWLQIRYAPVDNRIWENVGKAFLFAEEKNITRKMLKLYSKDQTQTCAEHELMSALVFSASSPDSFLPLEMEITEGVISYFMPNFPLVSEARPENSYWIDIAKNQPPKRLAAPPQQITTTLRFFSTANVLLQLDELIGIVKKGRVPLTLNLKGNYKANMVLNVLTHLASYWSLKPPIRKEKRHAVKSRMTVIHGFAGVLSNLDSEVELRGIQYDAPENWVVENVSAGGFGVSIPDFKGDWLTIGTLLGLQPEGGDNLLIGIVRRFVRESETEASVGIQTLSKKPRVVVLRNSAGTWGNGSETGNGILLLSNEQPGEMRILLESGYFDADHNLYMTHMDRNFTLSPVELVERGEDFDLGRYKQVG